MPAGTTRRDVLRAGAFAGLALPDLFRHGDGLPAPRARSVIHLALGGGMAAQETFDPKPDSPLAYRGDGRAIGTAVDGLRFGHRLPKLAKVADRLLTVRSMSHRDADHERGMHSMLTGYSPSPAVVYPSLGSVVAHELGARASLPPYVAVPGIPSVFSGSGYLSAGHGPFSLGSDPGSSRFKVRDLEFPEGVDPERFRRRRSLRAAVGRGFGSLAQAAAPSAMDAFYERAYELLDSEEARGAFRIDGEPRKLRDRYGRTEIGQRMLLARRLTEAGVRYVTVNYGGFDMHQRLGRSMNSRLPRLDAAVAALITDLEERQLLESTLVLVSTEFGRTPKINPTGGRDHWPKAFSILLAGGGVKRGHIHGRTDAIGGEVEQDPVGPEDLARTLFTLLGIDPDRELMAGTRPLRLVRGGRMMDPWLA